MNFLRTSNAVLFAIAFAIPVLWDRNWFLRDRSIIVFPIDLNSRSRTGKTITIPIATERMTSEYIEVYHEMIMH